jgi:hypothetical protein
MGVRLKLDANGMPSRFFHSGTHKNQQMLVGKRLAIFEPHQHELHLSVLRLPARLSGRSKARSYQDADDKKLPHESLPDCGALNLRIILRLSHRQCGNYRLVIS